MRRLSFMLLLLAAALASYAQSATSSFYISVLDPAYVPTVTGSARPYTIHFNDPQLDSWVGQYGITDFRRAYSATRLYALKQVYIVTCTDPTLMDALQGTYPDGFGGGYEAVPVAPMVTPNDYGKNVWSVKPNNYVSSTIAGNQTYLEVIRARTAWDITKGDSTLRVGMVDRMVNRNHPDLKGKVLTTTPYPNNPKVPADTGEDKHGTLVAGFLGTKTDNDTGLAGIAWKCPIVNSSDMGDSANLILSHDNIRIINNSWAEQSTICALVYKDTANPNVQLLYDEVYENGTFVVCAAGNGPNLLQSYLCSDSTFRYPASYDHNFSVTSVGHFFDTATSGPNSGNGAPYNTREFTKVLPTRGLPTRAIRG